VLQDVPKLATFYPDIEFGYTGQPLYVPKYKFNLLILKSVIAGSNKRSSHSPLKFSSNTHMQGPNDLITPSLLSQNPVSFAV
jgi:hypothetical protein